MTVRSALGGTARRATALLPDAAVARIFPRRFSWSPDALSTPVAPGTPIRLFVGPVNSAGQGYAWARAAERHLEGVGAVDLAIETAGSRKFGYDSDQSVPEMAFAFANQWRRRQRTALVEGFTHLLLESGRFAYGSVPGSTPQRVAAGLVADGLTVALVWHGSDIRLPSAHAELEADSPFGADGGYPAVSVEILERNAAQHREFARTSGLPSFVSTPGLLDVPGSQWLPVAIDPELWAGGGEPLRRAVPVVAFAPSNSPMKGSAGIDEELGALAAAGIIDYRRIASVPWQQMPSVYRDADIVLDQFRLGDYGVAACEAMAAGRVVVGHVSEAVRSHVLATTGRELPIVEARLDAVADVVRDIARDPDRYRALSAAGPSFVREVHDGARSARALAPFLGTDIKEP
ncbi:hypothetical protein GCM10022286_29030 [Gryllotalpicola daejeonensis]|uniref:Glycosyltransferase n=1 Tax=Gryllotalpicola daejeonensis TaxID=993087 RepID=A0ABP7ZN79_9MICO